VAHKREETERDHSQKFVQDIACNTMFYQGRNKSGLREVYPLKLTNFFFLPIMVGKLVGENKLIK
jgi:hypothetical protein